VRVTTPAARRGALSDVDTSTPAVVLKLDPNVFHHGGLGVIRSLGRLGVPVHAVHEDPLAPAASSRYLRGRWQWTPGADDPDRIEAGLARLGERIGQPAVLLPTDDAGALFLAERGERLRRRFLFPAQADDLPRRLADKHALHLLCRDRGLPTPRTAMPASAAEAAEFVEAVGFPLVVKRVRPWRRDGVQARSTVLLRTRQDVSDLLRSWPGAGPGPDHGLMLQEYIPGAGDADWFFHGYFDAGSSCRAGFTGVKERSYPAHAGLTSLGRSADNPALREDVEQLLKDLSYRGLVDLDLRRHARDGRYRLLDFNPRLGAQFRVFEDAGGLDVVRAAYLDLTGQPVPAQQATSGRRLVVENYDLLAALGYRRRGELDLRTWLRSLRGVDEAAWFARDDLAPFGLMCVRTVWRAVRRTTGGGTGQPSAAAPRFRPGRAQRRDQTHPRPGRHPSAPSDPGGNR
jgi:predicted ATP-grasp superfamily ATP-dependent carboligase